MNNPTLRSIMEMDGDRRKEIYGNLCTDPERIEYKYKELGSFPLKEDISPEAFIDYFNKNVSRILYAYIDASPSDITVDISIGEPISFTLYGSMLETLVSYQLRMKQLKEAEDAWERKQVSIAEHDKWYSDLEMQTKETEARERAECLALSTDPELVEYQRLKAKFKVYEKVSHK